MLAEDLYDPDEFAAISQTYTSADATDGSYASSFASGPLKVKRDDYLLFLYEKSIKAFHLCVTKLAPHHHLNSFHS